MPFDRNNNRNNSRNNNARQPRAEDPSRAMGSLRIQEDEDDVIGTETWCPSDETFQWFLTRDFQLATYNTIKLMNEFGRAVVLREIKECSMHSVNVIERVLTSLVASGKVSNDKGHYSLLIG